jgi:WD40 repeat protein
MAPRPRVVRSFWEHVVVAILGVAVAPDGRTVLTACSDTTVGVWDSDAGKCAKKLRGHTNQVQAVAVSPDGTWAVSGSKDNTARVWDLRTYEQRWVLEGHTDCVMAVAVSGDGRVIVTGSTDATVRVWDANTGAPRKMMLNECVSFTHRSSVLKVAVSFTGDVVVGAGFSIMRVWDFRKEEEGAKDFFGVGPALDISRRGDRLLAGGGTSPCSAKVVDVSTGKTLVQIGDQHDHAHCVKFARDEVFAITVSYDFRARVWDLRTSECVWATDRQTSSVTCAALTPNGCHMITGDAFGEARMWDVTPLAKLAVAAAMEGENEPTVLGRFLRRDGDHAVKVRVLQFLL